jgi:hypothetical protein
MYGAVVKEKHNFIVDPEWDHFPVNDVSDRSDSCVERGET